MGVTLIEDMVGDCWPKWPKHAHERSVAVPMKIQVRSSQGMKDGLEGDE